MFTIKGFGCYAFGNMMTEETHEEICKLKGFVGYDDMPPIVFYFFLSDGARKSAIDLLLANFCLCGALENTIDIEPNFEEDDDDE